MYWSDIPSREKERQIWTVDAPEGEGGLAMHVHGGRAHAFISDTIRFQDRGEKGTTRISGTPVTCDDKMPEGVLVRCHGRREAN